MTLTQFNKFNIAFRAWIATNPQMPDGGLLPQTDHQAVAPQEVVYQGMIWPITWNQQTNVITSP